MSPKLRETSTVRMPMTLAAIAIGALGGCATVLPPPASLATAQIAGANGSALGRATIISVGDGAVISIEIGSLLPGTHGVHLHSAGRCDGPDFTTAGPHLNPSARQHGTLNPAGTHLGDLPNLQVAVDGRARLEAPLVGRVSDLMQALMDADGTAVVVHAAADDYRTDPSGNSGSRIACGVLARG